MKTATVPAELIPWDKSWVIRMGVLDLLWGQQKRTLEFLNQQPHLGDDLLALKNVLLAWGQDGPISVGESGTLYRFLRFACWHMDIKRNIIREGTLKDRPICDDPHIVVWSQKQLLELDHGTSQWASASALLDDHARMSRLSNPPHKLKLTYDAINHWHLARRRNNMWEPRKDETIKRQAEAFLDLVRTGKTNFEPQQAEDFCFAYIFCGMSADEGARRWPSLSGHESNRLLEVSMAHDQAMDGAVVQSRDHRVVQAVAMRWKISGAPVNFAHKEAVSKSWPQFWQFLKWCR